jgi:hypothetical protein
MGCHTHQHAPAKGLTTDTLCTLGFRPQYPGANLVHITSFGRYLMGHCHAPPKQDHNNRFVTPAPMVSKPPTRPCLETSVSFTVIQISTRLPHVFETQSPRASLGFRPADGSKALRLRFHAVIRGFAGFTTLESRSALLCQSFC